MKRLFTSLAVVAATIFWSAPAASASTIPYNCSTCGNHNTAFDITYELLNAGTNTYALTVTAIFQPTGASTPDYTYLNAISMQFSEISTYENGSPSLSLEPSGGPWDVFSGGLNANGCSGSGAGFFCAMSFGTGVQRGAANTTATWMFFLDLPATPVLGATTSVHFKGLFTDDEGKKVGSLISADFTATRTPSNPDCGNDPCQPYPPSVPEPAILVLMGAGLVLTARRLRQSA